MLQSYAIVFLVLTKVMLETMYFFFQKLQKLCMMTYCYKKVKKEKRKNNKKEKKEKKI